MRSEPIKILFVCEAVTLAHVVRLSVLARSVDPRKYTVVLASADRYSSILRSCPFSFRTIHSISQESFLRSLRRGAPLHDAATLRSYVQEDLQVLEETRPDMVVGDLRHSLAISARLARVPYISLVNAYWSPYAAQRFCVPDIPLTRITGVRIADSLFQMGRQFAFAAHCRPVNQVLREHGLPAVGNDLRRMYTEADRVIYPDVPDLVPTDSLPKTHTYVGPILWSPAVDAPTWWTEMPAGKPMVYITLGSSGSSRLLSTCLKGIADQPVAAMVATVGCELADPPPNARIADFLPGIEAAQRASIVICNGGSPTTHQALAAGTPVLGLPSNMDQHLNMSYVTAAGAGESVRSECATPRTIAESVSRLLNNAAYKRNAKRIQAAFASYVPAARFESVVQEVCASYDIT